MADRKIYIEVEWDDKDAKAKARALDVAFDQLGTNGARRATQTVGALEQAVNRARSSHAAAVPAVNAVQNAVKAAVLPVNNLTAAFTTGVFRGNAYWDMLKGGVSAIKNVATGLFGEAIAESNKFNNAMIGLTSVAGAFGQDLTKTKQAAIDLSKDGLMTVAESAAGLKNLIGSRFGLDEAISLMNAFKDSAAFNRQGQLEFGQAIVGATEGIKNQMSMMVDNAGVTKNLGLILKEAGYKEQDLGRAASDVGVRMALLNGILRETIAFKGDAAKLTQTYSGQMSRLDTAWKMTLKTWGDAITTNATVAAAIGYVTNTLLDSNVQATNNGKAWAFVTDTVILTAKALQGLLTTLGVAGDVLLATKIIFAELSLASFNWGAIVSNVNLKFLNLMASIAIGEEKQARYNKLLQEAKDLQWAQKKAYEDGAEAINNDHLNRVKWTKGIEVAKGELARVTGELEKTRGKLVEVGGAGGKVGENLAKAGESAEKMAKNAKEAVDAARESIQAGFDDIDQAIERAQEKEAKYWAAWKEDAREARIAIEEEVRAIEQAILRIADRKLDQMDEVSQAAFFQNFTDDPSTGFKPQGSKAGGLFKSAFLDALEDISQIIIDTIVNGGDWNTAGRAIAARLGGALGQSIGAYFGGPAGAVIGEALGTAIGASIGKMVFGPSAEEDIKKRVSQWGKPISEGLAQAIADVAKSTFGGNRQAAEIFSLDKILGEVGLDSGNLSAMTGKLRDVFSLLQQGLLTAAQATEVLNNNWDDFVEAGTDGSGRLSEGLREIIRLTKQHGLEVKAVTAYLKEQASQAISGSNAVVMSMENEFKNFQKVADTIKAARKEIEELNKVREDGRGVEWQRQMAEAQARLNAGLAEQKQLSTAAREDLELMGSIALATYYAAINAGMSHNEALKAAGPALIELQTAYENLGISAEDAGLKSLMVQAQILKNNPALIAGIDGLAATMIGLHNTGDLNVETFQKMEQAAKRMYTKLQAEVEAAGGTTKDALLPMQTYLREAEKQAKLLGIPLDAHTQMMIDQSKELGIWKDAGDDANRTMLDGLDDLTTVMQDLVSILRNDLPAAAGAAADGMNDAFSRVRPPRVGDPTAPGDGGPSTGDPGTRTPALTSNSTSGGGGGTVVVVVPVVRDADPDPNTIGDLAAAAVAQHIPRNGFNLRTVIARAVGEGLKE